MRKKIVSALLTLTMVLTLLPTAALAAGPFADVDESDWFYDAVVYVNDNGLMIGTNDGFRPNDSTTRAMIWTILARMDGVDTSAAEGVWYSAGQQWGIKNGVTDGTYPDASITREQFVTMLYRYAKDLGMDVDASASEDILGYSDTQSVSEYALSAMKWAIGAGIIKGIDGALVPQGTATRAQVAVMLYRFCTYLQTAAKTFSVTFDYNYGNKGTYTTVSVKSGEKAAQPISPSRSGYTFAGWYTASVNGTRYNFNTAVTDDMTLYAHWNVKSSGGSSSGHSHSYTASVTKAATCTESGVKTFTCYCGHTYTEEIAALGHDWDAGTEQDNDKLYTCQRENCSATMTVAGDVSPDEVVVTVNGVGYGTLAEAFAEVKRVGSSQSTYVVEILQDIELEGDWTSSSANYCDITINGNGYTISGLTNPLLSAIGPGKLTVKELSFDSAALSSATANVGVGAIVGFINCSGGCEVLIEDCHMSNSTVTAYQWAGAFVGATETPQQGPKTVKFVDCTVTDSTFSTTDGGCGALIGHSYCDTTIEDCEVLGTTSVTCTEDRNNTGDAKAGYLIGTESIGTLTLSGNSVAETVTLSNTNTKAPLADGQVGRVVGGGKLIVDGVQYVSSATELAAALTSNEETISVVLTSDIELAITSLGSITGGSGQYKLGGEDTEAINIDLGGNKLTITTTYWSALGAKNTEAVFTVKNGTMNSTGNSAGTWNAYDLRFMDATWNFEDVAFEKAVAIHAADATMKNVQIKDSSDNYALWITMDGQTVTLDGVTIEATRGIAINDQYVTAPETVTLNITDSKFTTTKKAAILVANKRISEQGGPDGDATAGATITLSNVDISGVSADKTNAVWKDSDNKDNNNISVTVTGGTCIVEP